ncbi:RIP homotypic interaction motif-containing protein [Kutzneria chonburiensis]|uniref:RIP homotypic interaction motif-containing protein n=1 Tax=Kutzneria chonburiensis TaxID=1483604 RepID=A0ABV6MNL3_9PSEU|nr:RIP homotypic interaction motif-containing protein [Kutzneria chonburiensis]
MIEIVLAALTAGATAGLTDTASSAVKDAYRGLLILTRKVLQGNSSHDDDVLEGELVDPQQHQEALTKALTAADAGSNEDLVAAARRLLALTDPEGTKAGKYTVNVRDSKGVQVGDGNTMTLNFGPDA